MQFWKNRFEWYIGTLLKQGWKYFSTSAIVYHIQHLRMRVFVQGFVLVGMWKYCPCFDTIPVRLCVHDSFLGHASGAQTTFSILLWRISTPVPGSRCGEIRVHLSLTLTWLVCIVYGVYPPEHTRKSPCTVLKIHACFPCNCMSAYFRERTHSIREVWIRALFCLYRTDFGLDNRGLSANESLFLIFW